MAHTTRPHHLRATLLTLAVLSVVIIVLLVRSRAEWMAPVAVAPGQESASSVAPTFKTEKQLVQELLQKTSQHLEEKVTAKAAPMWVVMRNSEPIPGALYQPGETCFIMENETVELIGKGNNYFVLRYAPVEFIKGSTCPKGTIFYLSLK